MTTWVKVFNSLPSHPKVVAAGPQAAWLFICGLCYANEHLTDGFIPARSLPVVAPGLRASCSVAARLVSASLWHPVENGWQIHGYGEHQRSADEVRDRRAKDRQRKASERSVHDLSARSPQGISVESAECPPAESAVVRDLDVEVEGRRQKAETERTATRKRATRKVDQSQPPENFPDALRPPVDAVLTILHRTWDQCGGIEPMVRGVALGVLRNPRADHVTVAHNLEHWLTAGRGQRAQCKDITARFADWVTGEGAALTVLEGGTRRKPEAVRNMDRWKRPEAS